MGCDRCGDDTVLLYDCRDCEQSFCSAHRDQHDCSTPTPDPSAFVFPADEEDSESADATVDAETDSTPKPADDTTATEAGAPEETEMSDEVSVTATETTTESEETTPAAETTVESEKTPSPPVEGRRKRTDPDAVMEAVSSPAARDAAREMRPDRETRGDPPKGRGLPADRGYDSVSEWMRAQSYPGYVLKVGSLASVVATAYYAGLAAVLYM